MLIVVCCLLFVVCCLLFVVVVVVVVVVDVDVDVDVEHQPCLFASSTIFLSCVSEDKTPLVLLKTDAPILYTALLRGNICFLGAMHHGKTTFMDLLVLNTHEKDWKVGKEIRF